MRRNRRQLLGAGLGAPAGTKAKHATNVATQPGPVRPARYVQVV